MEPVNNNIRAVIYRVGQVAEGTGQTKQKAKEIGKIVRDLLGHAPSPTERLSTKKYNQVTADLLKNAIGALPQKERVEAEKTVKEAYRLLDRPVERAEMIVGVAIDKMNQTTHLPEIEKIYKEAKGKLIALLNANPGKKNIHDFISKQIENLSKTFEGYQVGLPMVDTIKEVAGRKFPVDDNLKRELIEFCKDPDNSGSLKIFFYNCEEVMNLFLSGKDEEARQMIKDETGGRAGDLIVKASEEGFREIKSLVLEFTDRFLSINPQVHSDSMRLRLLVEDPKGPEYRKKEAIAAFDNDRREQLKHAKTETEKANIEKMMGFTERSKFAWDKAEWIEDKKNPTAETPFVVGERVITFLSKAPDAVPKEVHVPLDLRPLGELTHDQCLKVFGFLRESEIYAFKVKDEEMKPPFEMSPEKFEMLKEIKRNFNTTLIREIQKAYMTLDETAFTTEESF